LTHLAIGEPTFGHDLYGVPKLSEFFGISIYMYWDDHGPPHFHAYYAEYQASISIPDLSLFRGQLPPRVLGLVMEWAAIHRAELRSAWDRAKKNELPGTIAPLE
jgi:hypothetical protein